ncbi:MAG: hypothetical protein UIC65_05420 [Alphaproteobacteria bacterium]|nr:hypothetical protein [Alphaproteobacteria bacterium]
MQIKKITNQNQIARHKLAEKINELIDLVKEQQQQLNNHMCRLMALESDNKNIKDVFDQLHPELKIVRTLTQVDPIDPYAEQRKWIGKLCRCWDSDINDDIWGILQDIKDNKTEKYYLYGIGYEHCEPVKPDDDIIYKGGDNE